MQFKLFLENYRFEVRDQKNNPKYINKDILDSGNYNYLIVTNQINSKYKSVFCVLTNDLHDVYDSRMEMVIIDLYEWKIDNYHSGKTTQFHGILSALENIKKQKLDWKPELKYKDIKDIPDYLYHGTDMQTYENYIRKQGMQGQENDPLKRNFLGANASSSGTYVTDDPEIAKRFAELKAKRNNSTGVVLKIDVKNYKNNLFADEDYSQNKYQFLKSLNNLGTAYIKNRIYPKFIEIYQIVKVRNTNKKTVPNESIYDFYNLLENIQEETDKCRILYVLYGKDAIGGYTGGAWKIRTEWLNNYKNYALMKLKNIKPRDLQPFLKGMKLRMNSKKLFVVNGYSFSPNNMNKEFKSNLLQKINSYIQ